MIDASRYTISVRKAVIDGEALYEAKVRELPDVATYGEAFAEAYDLAIDAIESLAEAAAQKGISFPEPIEDDETVSGRITLRLPKSMHARAVDNAHREDVSLNTYLLSLISHGIGISEGLTSWGKIAAQPIPYERALNSPLGSLRVDVIDRGQWINPKHEYALSFGRGDAPVEASEIDFGSLPAAVYMNRGGTHGR